MANRIFGTLREWIALRRRGPRRGDRIDRREARRRQAARAGAPAVRLRAGDARRPQGADHPRASARGSCSSSRSRPTSRRASACWRRSSSSRCWRRSAAPGAARGRQRSRQPGRPRAGHHHPGGERFRDPGGAGRGDARARAGSWPGSTRPAIETARTRSCRRSWASTPDDTLAAVEAEIVDGPHLPSGEWASVAAVCASGIEQRQDPGGAAGQGRSARAARAGSTRICRFSSPTANRENRSSRRSSAKLNRRAGSEVSSKSRPASSRSASAARRSSCATAPWR